ncbi:hypothetical protein [Streptomyces sp. NPDC020951]|uniref:hypothetical protein n=1 Tax=Streptomyces sp. NPDC020951 TaxID=3365104 RepID=UPI0037B4212C
MPHRTKDFQDLVVFLVVLGTGTVLILHGVPPGSLATIAVALSGLYAVWRGNGGPPQPPSGIGHIDSDHRASRPAALLRRTPLAAEVPLGEEEEADRSA